MQYQQIEQAVFLSRPNRFIAYVERGGEQVVCHVKNTGRCRELLVPGCTVYLERAENPARKTAYDLVAVDKGGRLINMDAQAPNQVFREWAAAGEFLPQLTLIRPECKFGASRFDFYLEAGGKKIFLETKGVTLEEKNGVFFPDAPTERGVRHVEELIACRKAGYGAYLFFVIQLEGVDYFAPNDKTHPEFGAALRRAQAAGVQLIAYDCLVSPNALELHCPVEIRL
jgi:sugar fermentation stimulation protein A